jgi:hypothetical protein
VVLRTSLSAARHLRPKLRDRDSNPDFTDQNRTNYHYSIPQGQGRRIPSRPFSCSLTGRQIVKADRVFCYLEVVFKLKKLAAVLLLTVAAGAGAAGCGGDDSEDTPTPVPVETTTTDTAGDITKDELITQGDDICAEVNAAVGTIGSSTTADDSVQETQIADIYSGMAQRLEELGTPTDGDAPDEVIDAAQELADSGSTDGASSLAAFQSAATEYGFSECGDAPAAPSSSSSSSTGTDPSTSTPAPTTPAPAAPVPATPAPAAPSTGGGVAPAAPSTGGSSGSNGGSSGGIGPG